MESADFGDPRYKCDYNGKRGVSFTPEQVSTVCDALHQAGDCEKLAQFLWSLPPNELLRGHEAVLRARALVAYNRGAYHELYAILEGHGFDPRYHFPRNPTISCYFQ
ncbi:hypothetical protein GE061_005465 [Apolygus lucorum]|uniref:Homeobox protein SIX1 N-terminal SD domain-containing protein n=1 Tax=Apolygus lucorum TaxID=248454 RepID=A0A8S9WY34_APOLU|nr:hypothetical protein GE061_005465 [Apolygus lucorum]